MRRHLTPALLLSLLGFALIISRITPSAADAGENGWDFPQLMAALAKVERVDGVFEERKEITALDSPLVSSGFLHYQAPGLLEKEVLHPSPANYRIDGDQITVSGPDTGQREFTIDQYSGVRALVESLRATLAGDGTTLERYFHIGLTGNRDDWSLRLEPRDDDIARRVIAIIIGGSGDRILRVETQESGGDRTVMTIAPSAD